MIHNSAIDTEYNHIQQVPKINTQIQKIRQALCTLWSLLSILAVTDASHEHLQHWMALKRRLAGGFRGVEAVKQPNQKQVPGWWGLNNKKRLSLNPRCLQQAQEICVSAAGSRYCLVGQVSPLLPKASVSGSLRGTGTRNGLKESCWLKGSSRNTAYPTQVRWGLVYKWANGVGNYAAKRGKRLSLNSSSYRDINNTCKVLHLFSTS